MLQNAIKNYNLFGMAKIMGISGRDCLFIKWKLEINNIIPGTKM